MDSIWGRNINASFLVKLLAKPLIYNALGHPQKVELPLNPALREAVNEVRKQKRKMRRTRAAERAIFDTAEMEKLAQVQGIRQPSFDQMVEEPQTKKMKMD